MDVLIDIVSSATGQIFAEGLCGIGSARRWLASRGLTEDYFETDEEFDASLVKRSEYVSELEALRTSRPDQLHEIERELDRVHTTPAVRFLYFKEEAPPMIEFPIRVWSPPFRDEDGSVLDAGFWLNESWVMTTNFAD